MNRRDFLSASALGAVAWTPWQPTGSNPAPVQDASIRAQFPRLGRETFLNGAGGTPLGNFADAGIRRQLDLPRLGPDEGRGAYQAEVWGNVRKQFAGLIGAREDEIGLVECTKAGEQLALEGVEKLWRGGNVVTNDMHFSGSLHNYEGLRRGGLDVRVVRCSPDFDVTADQMAQAIDARTAVVAVSLVSNVNGRVEPMSDLARVAHERGAIVFADIIQAVGTIPIDVDAMGIDVAASSSYKWLYGIHGAGFLFVRRALQGTAIRDRIFPGHVRRNYAPFASDVPAGTDAFAYMAPSAAVRYQPGHVAYSGYAAAYEGMKFVEQCGGPSAIQRHSAALVRRLVGQLDTDRWRVLTPEPGRSPILALQPPSMDGLAQRLAAARVVVSLGGDMDRLMRISPAIYNTETDIDHLVEVLRAQR